MIGQLAVSAMMSLAGASVPPAVGAAAPDRFADLKLAPIGAPPPAAPATPAAPPTPAAPAGGNGAAPGAGTPAAPATRSAPAAEPENRPAAALAEPGGAAAGGKGAGHVRSTAQGPRRCYDELLNFSLGDDSTRPTRGAGVRQCE